MAANLRVDHGSGQFVTICAGGQSVMVELDHTGAPIDPRHHCPDCIALVVLAPQYISPQPHLIEAQLTATTVALSQATTDIPSPSARAPPETV